MFKNGCCPMGGGLLLGIRFSMSYGGEKACTKTPFIASTHSTIRLVAKMSEHGVGVREFPSLESDMEDNGCSMDGVRVSLSVNIDDEVTSVGSLYRDYDANHLRMSIRLGRLRRCQVRRIKLIMTRMVLVLLTSSCYQVVFT